MSFVKIKDRWNRRCVIGTAKVVYNKNGGILTETEYGYRFNTLGASKQIITKDGTQWWLRQYLAISTKKGEFDDIVKSLGYGDKIFVFGVLTKFDYTNETSGLTHKRVSCNAEYITKIGSSNNYSTPPTMEEQQDEYEDEFPDF